MVKGGVIYILTNENNTTLYTGVTSDLISRVMEHRQKKYPNSFTSKYNISKLVYFEAFHSIEVAIAREKQIKAGSRQKKIDLIESINPHWHDLYDEILSTW
jgi:putative endonuclease